MQDDAQRAGPDGTGGLVRTDWGALARGARPPGGADVAVEGGGRWRGLDLSGWSPRRLVLGDALGLLAELLPRPVKPGREGREVPVLEECDLSGLRCRWFDPGLVRFRRCRFLDVRVHVPLGAAHFEDCVFSGVWDGVFHAAPLDRDPARRVVVAGNDMRGLRGMSFLGGVPRGANRLDPARHLVLQVGGAGWDEAVRLSRGSGPEADRLAVLVSSLQGRGPLGLGQDWAVLDRAELSAGAWAELRGGTPA